jgi:hypothetical protein
MIGMASIATCKHYKIEMLYVKQAHRKFDPAVVTSPAISVTILSYKTRRLDWSMPETL